MNLQGLGTLMLDAVRSLDLYLVMGSVLMGSVLLLLGNLLADVALTLVDPRIDFRASRRRADDGGAVARSHELAGQGERRRSWRCSTRSALFAPFVAPYDYAEQNRGFPNCPPSRAARESAGAAGRPRGCSSRTRYVLAPGTGPALRAERREGAARLVHARQPPHDRAIRRIASSSSAPTGSAAISSRASSTAAASA